MMTDVDGAVGTARRSWLDYAVCLLVALSGGLMFYDLGRYPFWGDEGDTVIFGRGAWETGDLDAWYGDNLYAYRNGAPLEHLKNRSAPPLPFYLVAPFWGLFGDSTFWLRVPFALCGLGVVALMARNWRRLGFTPAQRLLLVGALACSTSFVLYARQCRYYALATLLSVALVALYVQYDGTRRRMAQLVVVASLLIAVQFMNFAALMGAVLVDYLVWQNRVRRLSTREWLVLLIPVSLVFCVLVYVYNPLGKDLYPVPENRNWWLDKLKLLWWSVRDLNRCEYGALALLALAPLVGWRQSHRDGNALVLRLFVGSVVFLVLTTLLSPQPVDRTSEADVRYLMPLIVPGTALTILVLLALVRGRVWMAAPIAGVLIFSNVLHIPWKPSEWRSSLVEYVAELRSPRSPSSRVVSDWLKQNVPPGRSVALLPTDWIAPLIIHAPHAFYAWQLDRPKRADDYAGLDERLFLYHTPVDVIVLYGFGNLREVFERDVLPRLQNAGQPYQRWTTLDTYYDDRTRPELIWHWFHEQAYDREKHAVYVYRRSNSPSLSP